MQSLLIRVCLVAAEGLWLPPGPAGGGPDAGRVLRHGPAVVRGRHRALHLPCQQPEGGIGVRGARRAAQVPGHPRAEGDRLHDIRPDGLLRLHDVCAQGARKSCGEVGPHVTPAALNQNQFLGHSWKKINGRLRLVFISVFSFRAEGE